MSRLAKISCPYYKKRHHTSICEKSRDQNRKEDKLLTEGTSGDGILPEVVVKGEGIVCRALIDSGAGSSYASGNSSIN